MAKGLFKATEHQRRCACLGSKSDRLLGLVHAVGKCETVCRENGGVPVNDDA